jgi:hypothetical protein
VSAVRPLKAVAAEFLAAEHFYREADGVELVVVR